MSAHLQAADGHTSFSDLTNTTILCFLVEFLGMKHSCPKKHKKNSTQLQRLWLLVMNLRKGRPPERFELWHLLLKTLKRPHFLIQQHTDAWCLPLVYHGPLRKTPPGLGVARHLLSPQCSNQINNFQRIKLFNASKFHQKFTMHEGEGECFLLGVISAGRWQTWDSNIIGGSCRSVFGAAASLT